MRRRITDMIPRASAMLGSGLYALAAIALVLAIVLPPAGIGLPICRFHATTGLPCPGCGLTRSVTSLAHLKWRLAWSYHPMGYAFFAAMLLLAPAAVIEGWRRRLETCVRRHDTMATILVWGLILAVMVFGGIRIAWILGG